MNSGPKREVHISQEQHLNSCVVLGASDGPLDYQVEPGSNMVLVLDVEDTVEGTSICLSREIVLEVACAPPFGRELNSEQWLVQAMYRYGDRNLQFESTTASGTLTLQEPGEDGIVHGQLDLTFTSPHIDLFAVQEAPLALRF